MLKEDKKKSVRLLLLQAWRERWTDIEWGIQLKKLLPHGISGDTYNLSELILSQALVGFSPNSLMLTYLQNAVSCQVVSLAATLRAIVSENDFSKPHCTKMLMEMAKSFLPNVADFGSTEEPMLLAKYLLATIKWSLACCHKNLLQLTENKQNPDFVDILNLMCEVLHILLSDQSSRALIAIAIAEDADLYREICQIETNVRGILSQLNGGVVTPQHRQNVDTSLKLLGRVTEMGKETCGVLTSSFLHNPTVNVIIQQEAILNPAGAIEPIVDVLTLVEKMQCMSRAKLLCDVIRAGFLGIIDVAGGTHELEWVAFTFLKIPLIFGKLQSHATNACENMERACQMLLQYSALIEALESKYPSCNCLQIFLDLLTKNGLLNEKQTQTLLSSGQLIEKKISESATQGTPTLIIRAESTVASILKTLDADYSKNQEALFGVLCHMMSGKSFELILAAAAANGKLRNFALKLIRFNEFAKASTGEGSRASVTRSQLFDISFLMLCHIAQSHGLEIMENREANTEPFFYHWVCNFLPLQGQFRSMDLYKQPDQIKLDSLLSQINVGGELKTSLVRWFDVCGTIPFAMREVVNAWEAGVIQVETVKQIVENLKSRLGCLAVVACAWLCSYINVSPENCRKKPRQIIDMILSPSPPPSTDAPPNQSQNYTERAQLLYLIGNTMTRDAGILVQESETIISGNTLALDLLTKTLRQIYKDGCVKIKTVRILDKMLSIGGVDWFCETVILEMLNHNHPEDLNQAVAVTLAIFLLNIEQLSLCFLNRTLPKFLQGSDYRLQNLVDPKGKSLAQFSVMMISLAVQLRPYLQKFPAILKRGAKLVNREIKFEETQEVEESKPNKQRKMEVLTLQSEFNFDLQESLDDSTEHYDTKDPLNRSMSVLFSLLNAIVSEPVLSPRNGFIVHFIKESVRCGPHSRYILQFMTSNMLQHLQKSMPGLLDYDVILAISDVSTSRGRCIAANAVCQAKRQEAWRK